MYKKEQKKIEPSMGYSHTSPRGGMTNRMNIPNSAMLSAMRSNKGTETSISDLDTRMRQKSGAVRERPQAQIRGAENEADRISFAVNVGTPESVKAVMGQRMGADFSGVRFHTGAEAAAKADAMGARAYTSGADVYFGSGGFDASIAAHELVHTAQQGMVDSSMSVMSTPIGGVQMKPSDDKKKKNDPKQQGQKKEEGDHRKRKWLWEHTWGKTGGRLIRKNHDAMDELHEAMKPQDGATESDWDSMSRSQRLSWKVHNPIAYARYMRTLRKAKKDQNYKNSNAEAAETRIQKKKERDEQAGKYLEQLRGKQDFASSMLTTDKNNGLRVGAAAKADEVQYSAPGSSLWNKITQGSEGVSAIGGGSLGYAGGALEAVKGPSNSIRGVGGAGGILGLGTDGINAIDHTSEIISSLKDGDIRGAGKGLWDLTGDVSSGGGNVSSMAKAFAKEGSAVSERAGDAAAGFGVVNGGLKVGEGTYDIGQGSVQSVRAGRLKNSFEGTRSEIAKRSLDDLLVRDAAALGKMEGTRRAIEGVGKVSGGLQGIAAGAMELGGVSAVGGIVMQGTQSLNDGVFKAADHLQRKRMKKKVVEQTTGLTNEEIRKFQKQENIDSFSRAKQSLMRSQGYSSGKRAELFADQTEKRGEYLAKLAKDPGNEKAKKLAHILGVKEKNGAYNAEKLSKAMGLNESRSKIASDTNRIAAYKAVNAAKKKKGTP